MDLYYEEQNNPSLKRFEKMLRTDTVYFFDSSEFERIIKYYIDSGRINLAKKAISLSLEQHPDANGLHLLKAELLTMEEKFTDALQLLDKVEAIEPTNDEVFVQKGLLLSKQKKHNKAIDLFIKALELSEEDNVDILSLIGMEYLFLEDFESALSFFKNCLEIDIEDYTNLYNVIYCYDMLEKQQSAIAFLKRHIEMQPFSEVAWHQLGRQYTLVDNYTESLVAFDYALLIDEQFVGAYLEKAKALEKLGRHEEAIDNYLITTELEDPTAYVYLKIGTNFEKISDLSKASTYYLKSNEQDPFLDKPLIALTNLYFNSEDYQKAIFYSNKLLEINDENPDYWEIYAQSNLKIAFFEEAAKAFQKCMDLGDYSLKTFLSLADSFYFLGDYKDAIKILIKSEIYFHRHAAIDYRLSGLYFLIGSGKFGKKHILKALSIDAKKYKVFQSLFPTIHNSLSFKKLLNKYRNSL